MIFRTGNRPGNTLQPVAIEAAIRHQKAIGSASHLLSCADYLLQALPEAVEDLPVIGDLNALLTKVGEEIQAARVLFQPVEITPQQDAEEEAAARVASWWKDFSAPRPVAPPQIAELEAQGWSPWNAKAKAEGEAREARKAGVEAQP